MSCRNRVEESVSDGPMLVMLTTLTIDVHAVVGALDRGVIEKLMDHHREELLACAEPDTHADLALHLHLRADPEVVTIEGGDEALRECVRDVLHLDDWGLCTGRGHRLAIIDLTLRYRPMEACEDDAETATGDGACL